MALDSRMRIRQPNLLSLSWRRRTAPGFYLNLSRQPNLQIDVAPATAGGEHPGKP